MGGISEQGGACHNIKVSNESATMSNSSGSNQSNGFINWYRNLIRNSKYRWIVIVGSLLYFISPIDLLPDFIPVIGQIDDAIVITLLVSELSQFLIERAKIAKGRGNTADQTAVSSESMDVNAVQID
jgi:uncharacterized membrane protein YkvA (DUF1232 family)